MIRSKYYSNDISQERGAGMNSLFMLPERKKINDPTEAFVIFLQNWDSQSLNKYKSAKAIFLDNLGNAFALYNVPSNKPNISIDNSKEFEFDLAQLLNDAQKNKAKSVIIAENSLRNDVDIDDKRFNFFSSVKKQAKKSGINVVDLMSIHNIGYSSFLLEPA